jgi:hypothetical protein
LYKASVPVKQINLISLLVYLKQQHKSPEALPAVHRVWYGSLRTSQGQQPNMCVCRHITVSLHPYCCALYVPL